MIPILLLIFLLQATEAQNLCDYRVFNWQFYLYHNKDLIRAGQRNRNSACDHWTAEGANKGRQAHPSFYSKAYCYLYKDVQEMGYCQEGSYAKAITHYSVVGIKEQRKGNTPEFKNSIISLNTELLSISISGNHGGAISSIIYKNQTEILNSYDHGKEAQYIIKDSSSNLIAEAGNMQDGITDHSTTNQFSSGGSDTGLSSIAYPAYWTNDTTFPYTVNKAVYLNTTADPHLIRYTLYSYFLWNHTNMNLEGISLNMASDFNRVYEIDIKTKTYKKLNLPLPDQVAYTSNPIMYENGENVAIGIRTTRSSGLLNGINIYAYYGRIKGTDQLDEGTKMAQIYSTNSIRAKDILIQYTSYIAVGTLTEVVNSLSSAIH